MSANESFGDLKARSLGGGVPDYDHSPAEKSLRETSWALSKNDNWTRWYRGVRLTAYRRYGGWFVVVDGEFRKDRYREIETAQQVAESIARDKGG